MTDQRPEEITFIFIIRNFLRSMDRKEDDGPRFSKRSLLAMALTLLLSTVVVAVYNLPFLALEFGKPKSDLNFKFKTKVE
jgi:hypothetical protein